MSKVSDYEHELVIKLLNSLKGSALFIKEANEYVKEMNNWKDGPLGNESFLQRGTVEFTNLERITLNEGLAKKIKKSSVLFNIKIKPYYLR